MNRFFPLWVLMVLWCGVVQAQSTDRESLDSLAALLLQGERNINVPLEQYQKQRALKVARALERISQETYDYSDLVMFWNLHAGSLEGKQEQIALFEAMAPKQAPSLEPADADYMEYLWLLATMYRSAQNLPHADSLNNVLAQYVEQIPDNHLLKSKGRVYVGIHQNTLLMIQQQVEEGIAGSKQVLELAESTQDTDLIITAGHQLAEFYVMSRNMPAFLPLVEHNYQLDSARFRKSSLYSSTIFLWLDALIYARMRPEKVEELLEIIERFEHLTTKSLEYRLLYLGNLSSDSEAFRAQLERFEATNLMDLIEKLKGRAQEQLNPNDYSYFLISAAKALYRHQYYPDAMEHMQMAINQTKDVYAEQLSKDLAQIEANRVKREKDLEIANEKEKTQWYTLLTLVASLLLLVGLLVIVLLVRQSRQLKNKNQEIEAQRLRLEEADGEKAVLLKEIHHRIKNNFQIVSSLLELQSRGIEDERARQLAEEGKNRVKSMALIHQRLYQNDELLIHFDEYTRALVEEITDMYAPEEGVDINIQAQGVELDVDTAIPLGLIINELVTNAFKYGLDTSQKKLAVVLQRASETEYELKVKDNGQGLPEGFVLGTSGSLGLRLVKRLAKQLKGSVRAANENGAVFTVVFKDTETRAALS